MEKEKIRNSSIELLRIIAMFFIVLSHACIHSQFDISNFTVYFNKLFVQWGVLGNLGVDLYILISGYFLCNKKVNMYSITRLLLQVWYYSVILFLVCKYIFHYNYSLKDYCKVFLPVIFQEYWFFTVYFILILLCPYINLFLEKVERKILKHLIFIMCGLWIMVSTFTHQTMYGEPLAQVIMFYMIGAYFRLYPDNYINHKARNGRAIIISFFLLFNTTIILEFVGGYFSIFKNRGTFFYGRTSLLVVSCAIALFVYFINKPYFSNKIINTVGSCTFGVYLIHDNFAVRNIIWVESLKLADYYQTLVLPIKILISVLLVFGISTLIEYLRIRYLGKYFNRGANWINTKILSRES